MRSCHSPDELTVVFDDDHLIADTRLMLAATVREGLGLTGPLTLRADSGFYARSAVRACQRQDVRHSIIAKVNKAVHTAIEQLPQDAWTPIGYCLEGGSDVAETCYRRSVGGPLVRLIVRQVRPGQARRRCQAASASHRSVSATSGVA